MARYVVHVKGDGPEALADARFVADGFSWQALGFGPLWLLAKGAWISAILFFAAHIGFLLLAFGLGLPEAFRLGGSFLINLLVALEGSALRSWELRLKGFSDVALVAGDDPDIVEQRFFAEAQAEPPAAPAPIGAPVPAKGGVIGLFPNPPRRGPT